MRYSEINEFNKTLRNVYLEGGFNEEYSRGHEWDDIPFPNVNKVGIETAELWTRGRNKIDKAYTNTVTIPYDECPEFYKNFLNGGDLTQEWDVYIREIEGKPTWSKIFMELDELVGDTGDTHHRFPERIKLVDGVLFFSLGS